MSDGWFDRSYRSDEQPPADLDARILAAARRATRRWVVPAIAAGVLTVVAAAVLGFLVTGHEQYVSPNNAPAIDGAASGEALQIDVVQPSEEPDWLSRPPDFAPPGLPGETDGVPSPDLRTEPAGAEQPAARSPELDCTRSVLIGPLGGPDRRDLVQICTTDATVHVEIAWDGDPPCPSRLKLEAPAGAPVSLESRELVVAASRFKCEKGRWIRTN